MTHQDVIQHYGSAREAARQLGVTDGAISLWRKRGISRLRQQQIELLTRGVLKAEKTPSRAK